MPIEKPTLVLASTSPFRRELLNKLGLPFETAAPDIDESPLPDEEPESLVKRLSLEKAEAVAADYPQALIIGSDQVACVDNQVLGKPGSHQKAMQQLKLTSGKTVTFMTGLTLYDSASGNSKTLCEPFYAHLRELTERQIDNYLQREQPYNCAGSFKSESLGIALFARLEGEDPNALVGLPLIRLIDMLQQFGVDVL
ncbi:MAG: Maf family nucleotide pyrophosphatase [Pseudomonadota bacterium]|nr:Maf family nucleotide pyrophosphatase [Pseudomonadota bacterium]